MSTPTPEPLLTMVYSPTAVVSIKPAAGYVWAPAGLRASTGTQAQLDALRDRLHLTPLPDPVLVAAKEAKLAALGADLKAALIAQFESAPLGGQWQFDPLRAGCNSMLEKGDLASAAQGLQDALDHSLIPSGFASIVTTCIGLIQTAAPKFAAVQAATTVEAVNAV